MASTHALFRDVRRKVVWGRHKSSDAELSYPYSFDCLRSAPARIAWSPPSSSALAEEERLRFASPPYGGARSEASSLICCPRIAREGPASSSLFANERRVRSSLLRSSGTRFAASNGSLRSQRFAPSSRLVRSRSRTEERVHSLLLTTAARETRCSRHTAKPCHDSARSGLHRLEGAGSSWRERAKSRPRVIASRSAYASRGSVGL
jgi:hypothetical protein